MNLSKLLSSKSNSLVAPLFLNASLPNPNAFTISLGVAYILQTTGSQWSYTLNYGLWKFNQAL